MSNIASLLTNGPPVPVQGNRGKASTNPQGDSDGFAKQLSENIPAKGLSPQSSKNSEIEPQEIEVEIVLELSTKSLHPVDKMKLDYEFNTETHPVSVDVKLNIDDLELSSDLDVAVVPVDVLSEEIEVPFADLTPVEETPSLTSDVKTTPTGQEILAALNTQLSGKPEAESKIQKIIIPQTNSVNTETVAVDIKSATIELDPTLKSKSADIANLSKGVVTNTDTAAVSLPVQNVDAPKANNNLNADTVKVPVNNSLLTGLASGGGLPNNSADQQGSNGSNQFANQVDKAGVKVDGVEVLEARVFPAISSSNSANIADALLKTSQVSGNTGLKNPDPIYNTSQPKTMNTLKIQLVPANLGTVTAVMKLTGEELQVELRVDNIEAYRKLSSDSASIVNTLKNQGFGIEQVNVQLMNGDRGSQQQNQQQNGQLFQDQNQHEASSGFSRGRGDSSSSNPNDLNQELNDNETDVLPTHQVTDLSNGVYL